MSILELTGAESCKECGERAQAERDRLQAENAKLVMKLNAEHIVRQNVERENAKLRELVEDMLDCIEIRTAWHRPLTDEMCEEFAQRARELVVDA